jgi:hypothetical protein
MSSFQRQLNLYGFRRVARGQDTGSYYHPQFQRHKPELVADIRRLPQGKNNISATVKNEVGSGSSAKSLPSKSPLNSINAPTNMEGGVKHTGDGNNVTHSTQRSQSPRYQAKNIMKIVLENQQRDPEHKVPVLSKLTSNLLGLSSRPISLGNVHDNSILTTSLTNSRQDLVQDVTVAAGIQQQQQQQPPPSPKLPLPKDTFTVAVESGSRVGLRAPAVAEEKSMKMYQFHHSVQDLQQQVVSRGDIAQEPISPRHVTAHRVHMPQGPPLPKVIQTATIKSHQPQNLPRSLNLSFQLNPSNKCASAHDALDSSTSVKNSDTQAKLQSNSLEELRRTPTKNSDSSTGCFPPPDISSLETKGEYINKEDDNTTQSRK